MSTVAGNLRYLYEVEYADGSSFSQPQNDRYSKHDEAADHNPSAFRDVLERAEKSKIVRFSLIGEGHRWSVDLRDGHFEIDNIRFEAHPQWFDPTTKELEVAYWREVKLENDMSGTVQEDGSFKIDEEGEERHYVNRYFMGFKVVGEDFTQAIAVG